MKTKVGFLDFSHPKGNTPENNGGFDVDLMIKELLEFGSVKSNKTTDKIENDACKEDPVENNTIYSSPSISTEKTISNNHSTGIHGLLTATTLVTATVTGSARSTPRMVGKMFLILLIRGNILNKNFTTQPYS